MLCIGVYAISVLSDNNNLQSINKVFTTCRIPLLVVLYQRQDYTLYITQGHNIIRK